MTSEFKKYWHMVKMPLDDNKLIIELDKLGLKPRKKSISKNISLVKNRKKKHIKITNTHLLDLGIDLSKEWKY
jgi:hypothetical protein